MRRLPAVLPLALALAAPAAAEPEDPEAWREAEVVGLALARDSLADVMAGTVEAAAAEVTAARRWDNPVLSATFEQGKDAIAGGGEETIYAVTQQFEFQGRRSLRRRAAEARVAGAEQTMAMLRLQVAARVRQAFYEVLAAQERAAAAEDWRYNLERVAQVVELRDQTGDVSAYDRVRVRREGATVRAQAARAEADRAAARARLIGMMGLGPTASPRPVAGSLLPRVAPAPVEELLARVEVRPDVEALRREVEAAALDLRVARGFRVPGFSLGVGHKDGREAGRTLDGPVAYAAVPLPLLDQQQAPSRRARAARRRAEGSLALLLQETRGEVRGAYARERRLVEVAETFRQQALEPARELVAGAEQAYAEEEVGVLSLLDAYAEVYEARAHFLELALAAREARIELDRLTGAGSPPED